MNFFAQINPAIPPQGPADDSIFWIIGIVVAILYLASLWARRDNAIYNLKYMLIAGAVGLIEYGIFIANNWIGPPAWIILVFSVLMTYRARPANRNRRISSDVRRTLIKKWEKKTGNRYNSRKYEIDHIVPFSRGGGHTIDNLRVIEKSKNRSKGARVPWWDVLGRINDVFFR